jgi:outer membrane autotransporter protein
MKFSHALLLGVAVAAASSVAQAADLIVDEPAVIAAASSVDWSGFYAGVNVGYGAGTIDLDVLGVGNAIDDSEDISGWLAGAQIGYNFQMDQVVLGVQTDLSLAGIESEEAEGGVNDTINWLGSTTARLGVALDGVLPYVKAGVAYGSGTGNQGDPPANEAVDATFVGWTVGAGVEFAVADNISIFGEYNYYDLGTQTLDFVVGANRDVDASPTLHTVKAGLNFGF